MKISNNAKRLIIINTIRKIIDIFLGPFLTAYFFKISTDSITIVSLYNIFSFLVIAVISIIVGSIIKGKYELKIFRLGMIIKFIQLMVLVILGKRVIDYIWLVGIISGISTITWSFPLNLLSATSISNEEKKEFVVYKTMFTNIVKVIVPVLFGSLISIESFERTAIIVLLLSIIQILLSYKLEYEDIKQKPKQRLNLIQEYKKLKTNRNVIQLFKTEFFQGMTYEGALDTSITLLIIIVFNTDFNLGVVTSIISGLSIISSYMCRKIIKPENKKTTIFVSCIIPLLCTIVLLIVTNKYTIIAYSMVYTLFIQIISILKDINTLKLMNSEIINNSNRVETFVSLEIILGIGRIISYILLLMVGILGEVYLLKILIIILTLCIWFMGKNLLKIEV